MVEVVGTDSKIGRGTFYLYHSKCVSGLVVEAGVIDTRSYWKRNLVQIRRMLISPFTPDSVKFTGFDV